jgi:hypothetical protein
LRLLSTLTTAFIYTYTGHNIYGAVPLLFLSPCRTPFIPFLCPLYLLGDPPSCDRIRPPWSQVTRELTSPSSTLPTPSPLKIPSTQANQVPHYDDIKNPASLVRNTPLLKSSLVLLLVLSPSICDRPGPCPWLPG